MPEQFVCPHCNNPVKDEWKVCPYCKEPLIEVISHYCSKCGIDVDDTWNVCPNCGESLDEVDANLSSIDTTDRHTQSIQSLPGNVPSTSGNPNILLGALSFILPIIGLILGIVFVSRPRPVDKHTGKLCFGWAVGGIILFVLFSIVCSVAFNEAVEETFEEIQDIWSAKDVELVDYEIESRTFGTRYIVGTVKNNSNHEYSYLQIEFNLYDSNGVLVGNALDSIDNLKPNEIWRFEALIFEDEATRVEVEDITGF